MTVRRTVRRLWPLLLAWVLLGANECSESSVNADINDVFGINTDDPFQVGLALLGAKGFGSDEERQAAEMGSTLKEFRRADHEQKGDRLLDKKDYDGAAKEYREALKWTGDGKEQDKKRASLEDQLALTLEQLAETTSDKALAAARYRESAAHYGRVAELTDWQDYKAQTMLNQAYALRNAGDLGASCSVLRKAGPITPDVNRLAIDILRGDLKQRGLDCP